MLYYCQLVIYPISISRCSNTKGDCTRGTWQVLHSGRLQPFLKNIRLGSEWLLWSNVKAYLATLSVTKKKVLYYCQLVIYPISISMCSNTKGDCTRGHLAGSPLWPALTFFKNIRVGCRSLLWTNVTHKETVQERAPGSLFTLAGSNHFWKILGLALSDCCGQMLRRTWPLCQWRRKKFILLPASHLSNQY